MNDINNLKGAKILLPLITGLGNQIQKTPLIHFLENEIQNSELTFLVNENHEFVKQLFRDIESKNFLVKKTNVLNFYFGLRKENFDYFLIPCDTLNFYEKFLACFFLNANIIIQTMKV